MFDKICVASASFTWKRKRGGSANALNKTYLLHSSHWIFLYEVEHSSSLKILIKYKDLREYKLNPQWLCYVRITVYESWGSLLQILRRGGGTFSCASIANFHNAPLALHLEDGEGCSLTCHINNLTVQIRHESEATVFAVYGHWVNRGFFYSRDMLFANKPRPKFRRVEVEACAWMF